MNKRSAKIQPSTDEDLWTAVDRYITDLLVRPDDSLHAALKASAAAGRPAAWRIPKGFGELMRRWKGRRLPAYGTSERSALHSQQDRAAALD